MKFSYDKAKHVQWSSIINAQKNSGQNITEYCKTHDLDPKRFYVWKSKILKRSKSLDPSSAISPPASPVEFKESSSFIKLSPEVSAPLSSSVFILEFDNNVKLKIESSFDSASLKRLLTVMKGIYA